MRCSPASAVGRRSRPRRHSRRCRAAAPSSPRVCAPVHQRVLLAVRHPDFRRAGRGDGRGQAVPVGVVGDHQRQLDAALARARAHAHPARGESRAPDRESAATRRSCSADGGQSAMAPASSALLAPRTSSQLAEIDAALCVVARDLLHRAVQIDRLVVAGLAEQRDDALRLAERIGADEMRALGKQRDRVQQLGDLAVGVADGGTPAGRTSPR